MSRTTVDNVNQKSAKNAEEVFECIHSVMHLFRSEQYRVSREAGHDLAHLEGKILRYVADHPGTTLSDLVGHFGRDKGQLARVIKTLKDQGLVAGQDSETDRRSVRLALTEEGLTVHKTILRQTGKLTKQAVEGLSTEERRQLIDLLRRVKANLTPDR